MALCVLCVPFDVAPQTLKITDCSKIAWVLRKLPGFLINGVLSLGHKAAHLFQTIVGIGGLHLVGILESGCNDMQYPFPDWY